MERRRRNKSDEVKEREPTKESEKKNEETKERQENVV